jgi:preprotein translocase SecE subunit
MSSVTKLEESKSMADSELPKKPEQSPTRKDSSPGFFTIQKKGQGYWTRMGTAIAIVMVGVFTAYNLFVNIPSLMSSPTFAPTTNVQLLADQAAQAAASEHRHFQIALGVSAGFLIGWLALGYWMMNKPANVDFQIATDSEMKKVNWTSRKDLIASTKIVIIFMFSVAIFLFLVDISFQYLFHIIGVLKTGPFGG